MSERKQQLCDEEFEDLPSEEILKVTPRNFPGVTGFLPIHYSQNTVKCLGIVQVVIGTVCLVLVSKSIVLSGGHGLPGYYIALFGGIVFTVAGLIEVLTVSKAPKRIMILVVLVLYIMEYFIFIVFINDVVSMKMLSSYYPEYEKSASNAHKNTAVWITLTRLIIDGSFLSLVSTVVYGQSIIRRLPPSKRWCTPIDPGCIPSLLHLSDGLKIHHGNVKPLHPKEKYKMRAKQMGLINLFTGLLTPLLVAIWVVVPIFSEQISSRLSFYIWCLILLGTWTFIRGILEVLAAKITRNKCFVIGIVVMHILSSCVIAMTPVYEIFKANTGSEEDYYITPLYFFDIWYSEYHVNGSVFNVIMMLMALLEAAVVIAFIAYTFLLIWSAMGCLASYVTTNPLHVIDGYQPMIGIECLKDYAESGKPYVQEI